jgi:hypothetical protein
MLIDLQCLQKHSFLSIDSFVQGLLMHMHLFVVVINDVTEIKRHTRRLFYRNITFTFTVCNVAFHWIIVS